MDAIEALGGIEPESQEATSWLNYWHWLVPSSFRVICATVLGDAFLRDPHGSVWWLDAGSGKLELVGDQATWEQRLGDPAQINLWSGRTLVPRLEEAGLSLRSGQCYTYLTSPILGGTYDPSNFKVVAVQTHFNIWGPILEQLKDLPDGANVTLKVTP
jgi:hypothetical protein